MVILEVVSSFYLFQVFPIRRRIPKMKALLYYRTSGKTGVENRGFGYETQRSECRKYCRDNGIEIEDEYFSNGVSGELIDKDSALMSLLANLNGEDVVIITKSSCRLLGRSDFRQAFVKRELVRAGKKLICLDQPDFDIYTKDPTQVFMNRILEAVDVFEKMNIAIKLHKSRIQKVKKTHQKAGGRAPFGFVWGLGPRVEKVKKVDEAKRPIVEEIFRLAARGVMCKKIAELIEENYSIKMSAVRINKMIKNRFYIGIVKYGDIETSNEDFALINKVVFGRAQGAMKRNQHNTAKINRK